MAQALQIDTLAFSKRLKEVGAKDGLAEAIVEGITEGITAADTSELATQGDIAEVKADLTKVENALRADIAEVKNVVRTDIAEVKNVVRTDITEVKADITKVQLEIIETKSESLKLMIVTMIVTMILMMFIQLGFASVIIKSLETQ